MTTAWRARSMTPIVVGVVVFMLLVCPRPSLASHGVLDSTFGTGGTVVTDGGSENEAFSGVAVQGDGKIVAAGYTGSPNAEFLLVRYLANGSLDTSFDTDGKVTTDIGAGFDSACAVAIQDDGKILVAGASLNGDYRFALARYNSNGSLDATFGTGGIVTSSLGASHDFAYAMAVQDDGAIILGGYSRSISSSNDFVVARYTPIGALDLTFDGDGWASFALTSSDDEVRSLAIQDDGAIVAVGVADSGPPTYNNIAMVRLQANGALDTTFDGDGQLIDVRVEDNSDGQIANSVVIQPDGRIVVAGVDGGAGMLIGRYLGNGSVDTGFGLDGRATYMGGTFDVATSVAIQTDNALVVAGQSRVGSFDEFAILRFTTGGLLDSTFSGDGVLTSSIGSGHDSANALALQNDGNAVVAGRSCTGACTADGALVRYVMLPLPDTAPPSNPTLGSTTHSVGVASNNPSITVNITGASDDPVDDPTGVDGFSYVWDTSAATVPDAVKDVEENAASASTVLADGTSHYFHLRTRDNAGNWSGAVHLGPFMIDTLTPFPSYLDASFDDDGWRTTPVLDSQPDYVSSLAVQPDGKVVVAGFTLSGSGYDTVVARYLVDGTLDASFGIGGIVVTNVSSGQDDYGMAIGLQSDGMIVVAGSTRVGDYDQMMVVRYTSSGSLDASFGGGDGIYTIDIDVGDDRALSVGIQSTGKIIVGGFTQDWISNYTRDFAVVRILADGSNKDASFGVSGVARTDFDSAWDSVMALRILNDDSVVACGTAFVTAQADDLAVAKYSAGGVLDTAFSGDGKVTVDVNSQTDVCNALAIQSDNKVILGGYTDAISGRNSLVVRVTDLGALDSTFNSTGLRTDETFGAVSGLAVDSLGLVLAAGDSKGAGSKFALARYTSVGGLDPDFDIDGDGLASVAIGDNDARAAAIAILPNGKYVVGGYAHNGIDRNLAIARFNGATSDSTPPVNPTLGSSSHTVGVASIDPTVDVTFTGASDPGSGVDGFSYSWDTASTTIVDTAKDAEESATGTTSPSFADGNSYYFHLRTRDNAGIWSATTHHGPFVIDSTLDVTPPTPDPPTGTASADSAAQITWTIDPASDDSSGLAASAYSFDNGATWQVSNVLVQSALVANTQYTKTMRVRDAAGNQTTGTAISRYTFAGAPTLPSAVGGWNPVDLYNVALSWTAPAGGAASYVVRWSVDGYLGVQGSPVATMFTQGSLTTDTAYTFKICAVNADGVEETTCTGTVSATPPLPAIVTANALPVVNLGQGGAPLAPQWTMAWPASAGAADYTLLVTRGAYNSGSMTAAPGVADATPLLSQLFRGASGSTYCFRVRSSDGIGNFSDSVTQRCTTAPLNNTQLSHRGWTKKNGSGYYLNTYSTTRTRGKTLTSTGVRANQIWLVVTKCRTCGRIKVVYGSISKTISTRRSAGTAKKQLVKIFDFPSVKSSRTLQLIAVDGGKPVYVEGVAITKT